ncbi:hypothetical protein EES37_17575 [Streptomyces sp. ADI91-18]|nr:hypothetical protein EES37_17575 [Streptomyces sp. ADI91-18]
MLTALVPPGEVTCTSTPVPAVPDGLVAVQVVDSGQFRLVALRPGPKVIEVAPVRSLPVMVTWLPPAAVPDAGLTPVTCGMR